ncbi:MAG TPA: acyltransferase [Burkholderiales bacterium]|nr:acyltransferase [Burkholderiales bacterium]
MNIASVVPYFVFSGTYLLIGGLISRLFTHFEDLVKANEAGHLKALDGLRGFLALGVFFTHSIFYYGYFQTGKWGGTNLATFYVMTGQVSVALFFQITAFLFWTKVIKSNGNFDVRIFYISRIRRLVPMYAVSVLLAFIVIFVVSDFTLNVKASQMLKEMRAWLSFGFIENGTVNGVEDAHTIEAVYWTLAYEWAFYIALPFLALFAGGVRFALLVVIVVFYGVSMPLTLNFLCGAIAAQIVHKYDLRHWMRHWWVAAAAIIVLAFLFYAFDTAYGILQPLLLMLFLICILYGNGLFDLLMSRGAQVLGAISYSIYLVHCITLYVVLHAIDHFSRIADMPDVTFWACIGGCGCLAIIISAITYRYVEHPFMHPISLDSLKARTSAPT